MYAIFFGISVGTHSKLNCEQHWLFKCKPFSTNLFFNKPFSTAMSLDVVIWICWVCAASTARAIAALCVRACHCYSSLNLLYLDQLIKSHKRCQSSCADESLLKNMSTDLLNWWQMYYLSYSWPNGMVWCGNLLLWLLEVMQEVWFVLAQKHNFNLEHPL